MRIEQLSEYAPAALTATSTALTAAGAWVVRRVVTDSKRLSLLEQRQEMQHQELLSALKATSAHIERIDADNSTATRTQARIVEILSRLEERTGA